MPLGEGLLHLRFLVTLLLVGEILAWGSLGSLPVVVVIFVVEGCVSAEGGDCLHCAKCSLLFKSFISRCMARSSSHFWDMWLPTRVWLLLVCVVSTLPSRNLPFSSFLPCLGFGKLPCCWDLVGLGRWGLAQWGPDPAMLDYRSH